MHIGILQTGHSPDALRPDHGDYGEMFQSLLAGRGFTFTVWSVVDGDLPASAADAEGWLITGSRHGAYDDLPWIAPLERLIRDAYDRGVPMVGICFGHQIIAQALGGKVEKFADGWATGPTTYRFADGEEITLNAWHQDQVTQKPAAATTIATHPFCRHAALAYGDRALTVQPHPEYDAGFMAGLIEKRGRGLVPDDRLDAALANLDRPLQRDRMVQRIADFLTAPRA